MTIGELLDLYHAHHLLGKPSASYYLRLTRQVFPPISQCPLDNFPTLALLDWWTGLSDRPGHANKALGLLRAACRWGHGLELCTVPPAIMSLRKRPERTRCTTTSPEEWGKVALILEDLKLRHRTYFWALYLLGSRPGEVRHMRPDQLHLDRAIPLWAKQTSKNGRPHIVPIPSQLVPMLGRLMLANPQGCPWLFYGETTAQVWGRTSAQKLWEGVRAKAGLPHLWLNDLRRSTASDLLNQGESLGVVQGALNHRSLSQTAKYAYLAVSPLHAALQQRADDIMYRSCVVTGPS